MKKIIQKKSFWAGLGLIGLGIYQVSIGNMQEGIQSVIGGFGVIFIRQAIDKVKPE